jgi:hypothetical protein
MDTQSCGLDLDLYQVDVVHGRLVLFSKIFMSANLEKLLSMTDMLCSLSLCTGCPSLSLSH